MKASITYILLDVLDIELRMEVISFNDGLLTNREVLDLLEERRVTRQAGKHHNILFQDREQVELNTIRYLKTSAIKDTTIDSLLACLNAIKKLQFDLTEGEMVQIANHVPVEEVEIHTIVEECAERLDSNQIALLLETIKSVMILEQSSKNGNNSEKVEAQVEKKQ